MGAGAGVLATAFPFLLSVEAEAALPAEEGNTHSIPHLDETKASAACKQ